MNLAKRNSTLWAPAWLLASFFINEFTIYFIEINFSLNFISFWRIFLIYINKFQHFFSHQKWYITINLTNNPRGGSGGGARTNRITGGTGTGGGNRFAGAASSAVISGAFPLLFGQGPLIGAAGALGGGVGSLVGGQMGGFAGGLAATSIATPLQQLGIEAAKLAGVPREVVEKAKSILNSLEHNNKFNNID